MVGKRRDKRGFLSRLGLIQQRRLFNDPLWSKQWYMVSKDSSHNNATLQNYFLTLLGCDFINSMTPGWCETFLKSTWMCRTCGKWATQDKASSCPFWMMVSILLFHLLFRYGDKNYLVLQHNECSNTWTKPFECHSYCWPCWTLIY